MNTKTEKKKQNKNVIKNLVRQGGFLHENRYIILAFFVPFFLMFYAFSIAGLYPFGANQVAVIDMYHQYFPFINELQHKLQNGESLLHTWNGGLGINFISLLAYYTASPLMFLIILVPKAWLMEAVTVIIMIKISLGGSFMAIYLRSMYRRNDLSIAVFAVFYALCAYVMGYYWCIMWLDVVALLPLCILGLNRLIDKGDVKMYTISLAIIMFCNYYIGGMVCIFILFYYPILYFSKERDESAKDCAKVTGKAALFSILGICMAGVLLLPTFLSMQNTYYINSEAPTGTYFFNPLLSIVTNLLPDTELTVREGLPNVYCGLLIILLLVFFLICKTISMRKKLLYCGFLAFLILSLNWNRLDFIWHGLHYPNQLPFRYSFVVSFVLIILSYEAFLKIKEITPKQLAAITAGGAFYIILAETLYEESFDNRFAYVCLVLLFMYAGLMAFYRAGKMKEGLFFFLMFLVMFGEMSNHTAVSVKTVGSSSKTEYFSDYKDMQTLVEEIREKEPGFYRVELDRDFTLNPSMFYNYPGVSLFSSTANAKVSNLMDQVGLEAQDAKNRYNYQMTTPVVNAMLNIKYFIGKGREIEGEDSLQLVKKQGTTCLYENKYPLSVGYMTALSVDDRAYESENPFNVQNEFVQVATGLDKDLFHMIGRPAIKGGNVTVGKYQGGLISCDPENNELISNLELIFTSDQNQQVYVYVQTEGAESIAVRRGDKDEILLREDCPVVRSVGKCKTGETITVKIQYKEGEAQDATVYAYGFNTKAWEEAYGILNRETLQVTEYSDTKIKGTIDVQKAGSFITSIPYERGWSLKVDGKKEPINTWGNAFIAFPLKAGRHTVELHYLPEGLVPGILLTLASIVLLILLDILFRENRKRRPPEVLIVSDVEAPVQEEVRWVYGLKKRRNI